MEGTFESLLLRGMNGNQNGRQFTEEYENLAIIIGHISENKDFISSLEKKLIAVFNLSLESREICEAKVKRVADEKVQLQEEFQEMIVFKTPTISTGSIKAGTALPNSDYDYVIESDISRFEIKSKNQSIRPVFQRSGYRVVDSFYASDYIKFIHVILEKNNQTFELDIGFNTYSQYLADEVANLKIQHRMNVIATKIFFQSLHLIDSKTKRLTSGAITVAYLSFLKDNKGSEDEENIFQKFLLYWANFDYNRMKMTSVGAEMKRVSNNSIEVIDKYVLQRGKDGNCTFCTQPEVMKLIQQWCLCLSYFPDLDLLLLSSLN